MSMPDKARIFLTEICLTLGITTGLASYLPTINMVLDAIFTTVSIVAGMTVIIINIPKVESTIKKYLKRK